MLRYLNIRNLAVIESLEVSFQPGLNVITGETGAGKSVIVGALNLLLGDRADKSLLRSGADHCAVEAVFESAKLRNVLDDLGLPVDARRQVADLAGAVEAGPKRLVIEPLEIVFGDEDLKLR